MIYKPYIPPKFIATPKSTPEQAAIQLQQHALKHQTIAQERETARGWIKFIEDCELQRSSDDKRKEDEITKEM